MSELRPEVAACYELTSSATRLHVPRLGRDVDLSEISLEEADELMALPGGFEWLRLLEPAPDESDAANAPENETGPAVESAGPARAKRKRKL